MRLKILNSYVDAIDRNSAIKRVETFLQNGRGPHCVFAVNPEKNYLLAKSPRLYAAYQRSDLLLPDGVGMVWAARVLHGYRLKRLAGSDFLFDICQIASEKDYSVFVFGAQEKVNVLAVTKLKKRFPDLKIAGRSNGYVKSGEMEALVDRINASRADILFLALGSPRQEEWYAEYHPQLKHVKVCQCVGGALDAFCGTVKRAPQAWQKLNAEWLYRLISQPTRLRRQRVLPLFVAEILFLKIKIASQR